MDVPKRGRLIVFEGPDGSGKQTQSTRFFKEVIKKGHDAKMYDFPQYGQNIFANTVEAYLRGEFGNPTRVSPYLASLAYAGDRWAISDVMRQDLREGKLLVLNRYVSANMGHQGAKFEDPRERADFVEWCRAVEYSDQGFRIPKPDLTIHLDVDIGASQKLITARAAEKGKERDGHERNVEYLARVAETFREIAAGDPTWRTVDCMNRRDKRKGTLLKPEVIAKKVWDVASPYLPLI